MTIDFHTTAACSGSFLLGLFGHGLFDLLILGGTALGVYRVGHRRGHTCRKA